MGRGGEGNDRERWNTQKPWIDCQGNEMRGLIDSVILFGVLCIGAGACGCGKRGGVCAFGSLCVSSNGQREEEG